MVQSELRHALLVPQPASVAMAFNYSNSCSAPFFFSLFFFSFSLKHPFTPSSLLHFLTSCLLPSYQIPPFIASSPFPHLSTPTSLNPSFPLCHLNLSVPFPALPILYSLSLSLRRSVNLHLNTVPIHWATITPPLP